jgi:hypothetical protein
MFDCFRGPEGEKEAMRVRVGIVCTVFYYLAISKSFLLASGVRESLREDNCIIFKEPLREEYFRIHGVSLPCGSFGFFSLKKICTIRRGERGAGHQEDRAERQ